MARERQRRYEQSEKGRANGRLRQQRYYERHALEILMKKLIRDHRRYLAELTNRMENHA